MLWRGGTGRCGRAVWRARSWLRSRTAPWSPTRDGTGYRWCCPLRGAWAGGPLAGMPPVCGAVQSPAYPRHANAACEHPARKACQLHAGPPGIECAPHDAPVDPRLRSARAPAFAAQGRSQMSTSSHTTPPTSAWLDADRAFPTQHHLRDLAVCRAASVQVDG